ncbi:hypothetical protein LPJ61_001608, partial [Coemansia biformis]
APSQVLAGRVMFRLGHSLKVKRAVIAFQAVGCSRHQLGTSAGGSMVLLQEELFSAAGLPSGYASWKAGHGDKSRPHYEFPFSLVIPGHLHASVNTCLGSVCYVLRVTVQTCGFGINTWSESLRVPVYRIPSEGSPQGLLLAESLRMQADWLGTVELQVLSDTAAVADNTRMCARVVVRPLQKGLHLADIGLRLAETFRFKQLVDRFGDQRTRDRIACQVHKVTSDYTTSGLHATPLAHERSFDLELQVPKAFGGIQYSMDTPELHVAHDLVFTATVIDEHQNPRYLRISSPVRIVPKLALESAFTELPAYWSSGLDRLLLGSAGLHPDGSASCPRPPSYHSVAASSDILVV